MAAQSKTQLEALRLLTVPYGSLRDWALTYVRRGRSSRTATASRRSRLRSAASLCACNRRSLVPRRTKACPCGFSQSVPAPDAPLRGFATLAAPWYTSQDSGGVLVPLLPRDRFDPGFARSRPSFARISGGSAQEGIFGRGLMKSRSRIFTEPCWYPSSHSGMFFARLSEAPLPQT